MITIPRGPNFSVIFRLVNYSIYHSSAKMFNCDFNGSMEIMVRNNINHDFWWKNPITCWNMLVEASLIHPCEEPKGSVWLVPCMWMIIKLSLCSDTWFLRVLNIFNPLNPFLGDQKKHPTIEKILCFLFKILMVIDICGLFTFQMTQKLSVFAGENAPLSPRAPGTTGLSPWPRCYTFGPLGPWNPPLGLSFDLSTGYEA